MNQPFQDRFGKDAFADHIVSTRYREFVGDNGDHHSMAVLHDVQQIQTQLCLHRLEAEVIEDEKLGPGGLLQQFEHYVLRPCKREPVGPVIRTA